MSSDNCILGGRVSPVWCLEMVSGDGIRGSVFGPFNVHHFEVMQESFLLQVP